MFRFTFFMILAFFAMSPVSGAEVKCKPQPMGKVHVTWGSDNIEYDFTKSQLQMDRIENDTENPYGRNIKTHVGGLMQGGIDIQFNAQVAVLEYQRVKKVCQWVDNIKVSIKIDPKILIARDHKRGSCKHKAILDHEMKHVFVDREIVKKYVPIYKSELGKALRKVGIVGPKDSSESRKYQDKINGYLEKQLKIITDKMYAERTKRQQGVDTLEEYERVAGLCH